ncbi:hypothetical protein, partial [Modestobacter lacusdianchii]
MGELVQAYADPGPHEEAGHEDAGHDEAETDDTLLSWVQTESGDTVRVSTEDVAEVPTGATVEATVGEPVADQAAADGYAPALEVLSADVVAAPVPDEQTTAQTIAPVNHLVTVVMLQPAGAARDATRLDQVVAAVNGPVGDFWEQQSAGAVRVGVTGTVDWFQGTTTCVDPYALWSEAAARAGWSYAAGRHLLVYVPAGAPECSYGLGEVRQDIGSGGRIYVQATATSLIAHELGHNFGLGHSSGLQCDGQVEAAAAACQVSHYRDYYDVMGVSWSQLGTVSALNQAQLGVLPAAQRVDVTSASASADHTLSPISGTSGIRALRITAANGAVYWVEYRPASGRDAWLSTSANQVGLQSGVLLRRANPGSDDASLLLDPTPSASTGWRSDMAAALPVGSALTLAGGSVTLTVVSVGPGSAVVRIGVPVTAPLGLRYAQLGGAAGLLGAPLTGISCGLVGGGCFQEFAGGSLYWTAATGAHFTRGSIRALWGAVGWE